MGNVNASFGGSDKDWEWTMGLWEASLSPSCYLEQSRTRTQTPVPILCCKWPQKQKLPYPQNTHALVPTSPFSRCLSAHLFTACQGPRFWHCRALARELFALCSLCVLCALWRCSAHNNSSPSISQKHQHSSGQPGSY